MVASLYRFESCQAANRSTFEGKYKSWWGHCPLIGPRCSYGHGIELLYPLNCAEVHYERADHAMKIPDQILQARNTQTLTGESGVILVTMTGIFSSAPPYSKQQQC